MGGHHAGGQRRAGRSAAGDLCGAASLIHQLDQAFQDHWWAAVATVTRLTGDLQLAEDAVQDACAVALTQWETTGIPANPRGWLIAVARNKALDRLRRDARRPEREAAAVRELPEFDESESQIASSDDQLALIFMCCHPALDPEVRVPLTLRSTCGLTTAEIAASFLVPEATMAKRLVRARQKIRTARIPFRVPPPEALPDRLPAVLRVIYLIFTEGHMASGGPNLVRGDLCSQAIRLARGLQKLMPDEPEAIGLLALLLLTDARRAARVDSNGELVVLDDQDRSLWDRSMIAEGEALLERGLRTRRPGPYQLQAAIAACHSTAISTQDTDWRQIARLYAELVHYEPTPVMEANRAVAIAMVDGPAAGLVRLDAMRSHPQLSRWAQLHLARAELLRQLNRKHEANRAYRDALEVDPPPAQRSHILRRIQELN